MSRQNLEAVVVVLALGLACSSNSGDEASEQGSPELEAETPPDAGEAADADATASDAEDEATAPSSPEPKTDVDAGGAPSGETDPSPDLQRSSDSDAGSTAAPEPDVPPPQGAHGSLVYLGWLDPMNNSLRAYFYHDLSLAEPELLHEGTSSGPIDCGEDRTACVFTTREFDSLLMTRLYLARFTPGTSPEVTQLLALDTTIPSDIELGVNDITHAEVNRDGTKVLVTYSTGQEQHLGIFHTSGTEEPVFESLGLSEAELDSVSVFCTTPDFERIVIGVADGPRRILVIDTTNPTPLIWDAGELHSPAVGFHLTRDCQHALYSSSASELGIEYADLSEPDLPRQAIAGASIWLSADQTRLAYSTPGISVATLGDGPLEPVDVPAPEVYSATNVGTKVDFSLDSQQLAIRGRIDGEAEDSLWWVDLPGGIPTAPIDVSSSGPHGPVEVEDFYFAHDGQALAYTVASEPGEYIVSIADGQVGTPEALFPLAPEGFVAADYPRLPESRFALRVLESPRTNEAFLQLARVEDGGVGAQFEEFEGTYVSVTPTWHSTTVLVASRGIEAEASLSIYRLDLDGETPVSHLLAEHPGATEAAELVLSWDRSAAFYVAVYPEDYAAHVAFIDGDTVFAGGEEIMALQAFLF